MKPMKLSYRQYQWGGDYRIHELELPEGSHIYEVYIWQIGYKVKDKEGITTPGYVIKASEEFEGSMRIGDAWYRFENGIYIDDPSVLIEPIEDCIPPKECFIVFEQDNMKPVTPRPTIQFCNKDGNLLDVDWEALRGIYKEIAGIGKIRRFTKRGIETSLLSLKSMNSNDLIEISLHTFEYGHTWGGGYSCHSGNFFTAEEKYKNLFNEKLEEYYKLFKE